MRDIQAPLTLGTAGHVDHGKTALVAALTGVDTDRLPEEKARGLTIELGYAPLVLPSGRRLSLIDVPGHARFVRTMVSGASGIDLFLMVVAADDGVMPQTIEHAEVLRALGVERGVIAVTKADLMEPAVAAAEAAELLPDMPIVPCSTRTGVGLPELRAALDRTTGTVPSRAAMPGAARLHVDRVFTINGRGTVVTGTLWSGTIAQGDALELIPRQAQVRVRGIEIHGGGTLCAHAGQRIAVNLVGVATDDVRRGDVLATPGEFGETSVLDCTLELRSSMGRRERVQVLHGTRSATGRMIALGDDFWQLRLERPIVAADGDRLVIRRLAPPDTIGGGAVVEALPRRHGPKPEVAERLRSLREGREPPVAITAVNGAASVPPRSPLADPVAASDLERQLREAAPGLLSEAQVESPSALRALRAAGIAVRVSGRLYGHADTVALVRGRIVALIDAEGPVTLAGARDALGLSRKATLAFLEHLDNEHVTRRLPDDTRALTARAPSNPELAR